MDLHCGDEFQDQFYPNDVGGAIVHDQHLLLVKGVQQLELNQPFFVHFGNFWRPNAISEIFLLVAVLLDIDIHLI